MELFRWSDTNSGGKARVTAEFDGNIEVVGYLKTLEADIEGQEEDGRVLGSNWVDTKLNGVKGVGTMGLYAVTSFWSNIIIDYAKTGKMKLMKIVVENEDEASTTGKQVTALYNVLITKARIATVDIESAALEEEIPFTFRGCDRLQNYNKPVGI